MEDDLDEQSLRDEHWEFVEEFVCHRLHSLDAAQQTAVSIPAPLDQEPQSLASGEELQARTCDESTKSERRIQPTMPPKPAYVLLERDLKTPLIKIASVDRQKLQYVITRKSLIPLDKNFKV